MTKNPRIWFAVAWIAVLTALFCWSSQNNEILAYALIVALVGLKRASLVSREDGRAVVGALAFGGVLFFGMVGGMIIGTLAALAWSTSRDSMPLRKLPFTMVSGISVGFFSGIIIDYIIGHEVSLETSYPIASSIPIIAACLVGLIVVELPRIAGKKWMPTERVYFPLAEFITGGALSIGVYAISLGTRVEFTHILIPTVYLARQIVGELIVSDTKKISSFETNYNHSLDMVKTLAAAIDARENTSHRKGSRVSGIAIGIARRMNLSEQEIENLSIAALLYDVGKVVLPDFILLKPGKLAPEQYDIVKSHCETGQRIVREASFPEPISDIVRSHHERWDGTGYPDSLKGTDIPLGARILCLADVFDSMTSKRTYRSEKSVDQALEYIKTTVGSHFDPEVAAAFELMISNGEMDGIMAPASTCDPEDLVAEEKSWNGGLSPEFGSEYIAMFEIAQTASSTLDLDELLDLIQKRVEEMIHNSSCVITLNASYAVKRCDDSPGIKENLISGLRVDKDADVPSILVSDVRGDDEISPVPVEFSGMEEARKAAASLSWGDDILGITEIRHTEEGFFEASDLHLLAGITHQISLAIRNALIFRYTLDSAYTDSLTGLNNARYLFKRLDQEISRSSRLGSPLSVLLMDLDDFKPINDNFGHHFGDMVLRDLSQLFISQMRDYDLVCRYGGDEFVIVLPDADKDRAEDTARRIAYAVNALEPYTNGGSEEFKIGISIGIATYSEDGEDVDSLISVADSEMYSEKRHKKFKAA